MRDGQNNKDRDALIAELIDRVTAWSTDERRAAAAQDALVYAALFLATVLGQGSEDFAAKVDAVIAHRAEMLDAFVAAGAPGIPEAS